jgi:hypothetical protein
VSEEFPAWQVEIRPGGLDVITALWRSEDGRGEWYVVAHSSAELAERLREIGARLDGLGRVAEQHAGVVNVIASVDGHA